MKNTEVTNVAISLKSHAEVVSYAKDNGMKISKVIEFAIDFYLSHMRKLQADQNKIF